MKSSRYNSKENWSCMISEHAKMDAYFCISFVEREKMSFLLFFFLSLPLPLSLRSETERERERSAERDVWWLGMDGGGVADDGESLP